MVRFGQRSAAWSALTPRKALHNTNRLRPSPASSDRACSYSADRFWVVIWIKSCSVDWPCRHQTVSDGA